MGQEMPIFTKSFGFLSWLLPMTNHFPKIHRQTFTHRLIISGLPGKPIW